MTMHVVLGDGLLPENELNALLLDMQTKAYKADDPFWFLVQGKAEPTSTDTQLVQWLIDNDIYYEMVSDGSESDLYKKYQNNYTVKRLAPKVVSLMNDTPEEGEEAHVLALFAADDPDAEEDRWLNDVIQVVTDAGFKVLAMNDGMSEIKVINTDDAAPEVEEEEPLAEVTPIKSATKKVAKPAPVEEVEEAEPSDEFTREVLEEMDLVQLKAVAAKLGIELAPRTRMATYIDAILGSGAEAKDEEVEIITATVEFPEDGGEPIVTMGEPTPVPDYTITNPTLVGTAMLIVVYNGTVMSRAVSEDEARSLMA